MEIIKYNADIRLIHFPFLKKYQIQYGFSNWRDELSIDFDNFNNFDDANSRYEEFMKNKVVRECEELRIIRFKSKLNEYIYEIEQINEKGIWARVQLDGYSFAESWFMEEFNAIYYYEEVLKQMKKQMEKQMEKPYFKQIFLNKEDETRIDAKYISVKSDVFEGKKQYSFAFCDGFEVVLFKNIHKSSIFLMVQMLKEIFFMIDSGKPSDFSCSLQLPYVATIEEDGVVNTRFFECNANVRLDKDEFIFCIKESEDNFFTEKGNIFENKKETLKQLKPIYDIMMMLSDLVLNQ